MMRNAIIMSSRNVLRYTDSFVYGKWTFVKRGENFGIKLVKILPKIHKISLDMIAKDIFRSENK